SLDSDYAIGQTDRHNIVGNVCGVLLVMSEAADRNFSRGSTVWVRCRSHGGVAHRSEIQGEQAFLSQLQIIQRCQFHNEIVRMLPVCDGNSKSCLALLKEQRIAPVCHCCRFET